MIPLYGPESGESLPVMGLEGEVEGVKLEGEGCEEGKLRGEAKLEGEG
jgi:hypothetical protein